MKADRAMTALGTIAAFLGLMSMSVGRWIIGGIMLLVSFAVFWNRGFGKFNDRSIYEKVIRSDLSIAELYEKLRDVDTPLGRAWIAEHKGYAGDSIVFGPSVFSDMVVISRKGRDLNIKHITLPGNIIRKEEDEHRFSDMIDPASTEVTPERYSIFVSFKLASVVLISQLMAFAEALGAGRQTGLPDISGAFSFFYHNSTEGHFRDADGDDILIAENSLDPFTARVLDEEGNEMASVRPRAFNARGEVSDSAGFDMYADGEHFGDIAKVTAAGSERYIVSTDQGEFLVRLFPACRRANVACNYAVEKDGELKAVIAGSPAIIFDTVGKSQNDVIVSYDDDYLVLYACMEIFIITLNKKFLK